MEDLRSEVGEFRGFGVAHLVDLHGRRDDPRVRRHESVDVGPYLEHIRVEGVGDDRGGVVGPASAERQGKTVPVDPVESGYHGDASLLYIREDVDGHGPLGLQEVRGAVQGVSLGDDPAVFAGECGGLVSEGPQLVAQKEG